METIGIKLSESELQMFAQLFTYYDSDNTGIVSQSKAKQLLNSLQLDPKVLDQIIELSGCSHLTNLSRNQFYVMLKLVGAAQSGLPLNCDTLNTNALSIPLPQLFPLVDTNKHQLMANNIEENSKSGVKCETLSHSLTGHLPPPPTKSSVRSNHWNNQFSNSDNYTSRQIIETTNHFNSINNNNCNNNNNNHINYEQNEIINSRSSSTNELNDSPIESIEKSYNYRDKSWSEFNDKGKDVAINWADFDEEHHLLENEDEDDDEEEDMEETKSIVSSEDDSFNIWSISDEQRLYYTNQFKAMQTNLSGKITGNIAKDFFEKSCLPIQELSQIWQLSDVDKDGALTLEEFCVAMHLVVLRRNNVDLPNQLPLTLMPTISPIDTRVSSLNSSKCNDLVTNSEPQFTSLSPQYNDLNEIKGKNVDTLSPQNKEWTKFTDSPTNIVVTAVSSPPSTSSSAGVQQLANFDFNTASIVRDPKILHPVALRLSPDGQPIRYDNNENNSNHDIESGIHLAPNSETVRSSTVLNVINTTQGKKEPPPPPPPRPHRAHGHARSSSLDLNKIIVSSSVANDLICSQISSHLRVSNSEYGLTGPLNKEFPAISLNPKNLGAFMVYKKTRPETSLTNITNSSIDSLKIKYKIPPEVPIPKNINESTDLWQTIRSLQEYSKVLMNINNDLLQELIKVTEEKNSLELRLVQTNNGLKS